MTVLFIILIVITLIALLLTYMQQEHFDSNYLYEEPYKSCSNLQKQMCEMTSDCGWCETETGGKCVNGNLIEPYDKNQKCNSYEYSITPYVVDSYPPIIAYDQNDINGEQNMNSCGIVENSNNQEIQRHMSRMQYHVKKI